MRDGGRKATCQRETLAGAQRLLDQATLGDVAEENHDAGQLAAIVQDRRAVQFHRKLLAVAA